ncbi:MAG: MFS transporter [Bryobacteraceae bacterium]
MSATRQPVKPPFHYAWVIAALTFFVLLASAGVRSTPSLLMVPLEAELGWSRTLISAAVAINILLFGLIGPFAASWMDRWGLRRGCFAAASLVGVGVLLSSRMSAPWQLIALWGVMVGAGTGGTSMVLAAVVTSRWFETRRGLVLGVLSAANATGQLVFLPLMARVVEHSGWRTVSLIVGGVAALMAVTVALLMRDSPESMGLKPFGWTHRTLPTAPALKPLAALAFAARRPEFWLLAGTFFICGASTNGLIGTHLIPACHDHGIPEVRSAALLALMGLFDIAGTTASGWLTDRVSSRILLSTYYLLRGLSLFALPSLLAMGDTPQLTWFAMLYGLDWIATVPPTVRLTSDAFGRENTGVVYGWIGAAHQIGASLAAFGAGAIRTTSGDYLPAFVTAGVLCLIASAAFLTSAGVTSRKQSSPGDTFASQTSNP